MAGSDAVEVERKYSPAESADPPRLASIQGVERVGQPVHERLGAVYLDTEALTLAAQRITLHRYSGGTDAGWHLDLPAAAGGVRETAEPLGGDPDSVPARLRQLILVHTRGHALVPVARIMTSRSSTPLYTADGAVLATFNDALVEAHSLLTPTDRSRWREWEIGLVDSPGQRLEGADKLLAAGSVPAASPSSRLARALGSNFPRPMDAPPRPSRHGPAADVVLLYIFDQVHALKMHDPGVRADKPGAVHQLRVSARRLRSALATFRTLTDAASARSLRTELRWLAGTVGEARNIEVIRARLTDMIRAEPAELLIGPVAQQIEEHLSAVARQARAVGLAALDSDRYFRLLDSLDAFLAAPPLASLARKEALPTIGRLVSAERTRLESAVRSADGLEGVLQDTALHDIRKLAKRLRYAAEAASPIFGQQAAALTKAAEGIQEILGVFQDSTVTRETLREMAAQPWASAASGFSYGRLHALEEQRGNAARDRFYDVWQGSMPTPLRWDEGA